MRIEHTHTFQRSRSTAVESETFDSSTLSSALHQTQLREGEGVHKRVITELSASTVSMLVMRCSVTSWPSTCDGVARVHDKEFLI